MMTDHVLCDLADGVLTLTLNRPDKKNAITAAMYAALADGLDRAEREAAVRCVLLLSRGDSFTAGNDIATFANAARTGAGSPDAERFMKALAYAGKPLVAAVRGQAVGIGLTLLLHCDMVIVAEDARLSAPFVNLGLVPEAASSLLLVQRIGHARAFAMFAAGEAASGAQAAAWGIAGRALPPDQVDAAGRAAAALLASRPAGALAATKRLLRDPRPLIARMDEELVQFGAALRSPEAQEAFLAFAERRAPDFAGVARRRDDG